MKKLLVLLAISSLFIFGCTLGQNTTSKGDGTYKVDSIKAGKEEGTIDKEFFKKIIAEKPANVFLVDVRTQFEYKAGHFEGAKHVFINDLYDKGCDSVASQLPPEGYVVFVCSTGARASEMYFGIKDDCTKIDSSRLFFLDCDVAYTPQGGKIH